MYISIVRMSDYAGSILKKAKTGSVHSVYRKTINLITEERLLALQAEGSPLSPVSLITELSAPDMAALSLEPGTPAVFTQDSIRLVSGGVTLHFSFAGARKYDLLLHNAVHSRNLELAGALTRQIEQVLSQSRSGGFDSIFNGVKEDRLSLILRAARKRIKHCTELYNRQDFQGAALELSGLTGLGTGLTPGGDDFLCGVLAGLRLMNQEDSEFAVALRRQISGHLNDTIDISAAFLACALEDQFSLAVNTLCQCPPAEEILAMFSEIGHSSGMDTLCGVLYALRLNSIRETDFNSNH